MQVTKVATHLWRLGDGAETTNVPKPTHGNNCRTNKWSQSCASNKWKKKKRAELDSACRSPVVSTKLDLSVVFWALTLCGHACMPMQYVTQSAPPKSKREVEWIYEDCQHGQKIDKEAPTHPDTDIGSCYGSCDGCQPPPPDGNSMRNTW